MPKDFVPADALGPPLGLLNAHVDSFVTSLADSGYTAVTVDERRQIAVSFARWTRQRQLLAAHLDESHVASFLKEEPRRSRSRDAFKRNALRLFFAHLRAEGAVQIPPTPSDQSS